MSYGAIALVSQRLTFANLPKSLLESSRIRSFMMSRISPRAESSPEASFFRQVSSRLSRSRSLSAGMGWATRTGLVFELAGY